MKFIGNEKRKLHVRQLHKYNFATEYPDMWYVNIVRYCKSIINVIVNQ